MDSDKNHYFEQYRLYVNSIEKISDRRDSANKYFLTINSSIIVLVGLVIQYAQENKKLFLIGLCLFGLIICIIFWFLINSYKQLNSGKFKELHKIEEKLPLQPYKDEWKILGEGKDFRKYFPFSHIEKTVPVVFFLGYAILIVYLLII